MPELGMNRRGEIKRLARDAPEEMFLAGDRSGKRDPFQSGERRIGCHRDAEDRKDKMVVSKHKPPLQPSLFTMPDPIRSELKKIKTDQLTPIEALNILDGLKKKAEREE
jgi:hypothetical protein